MVETLNKKVCKNSTNTETISSTEVCTLEVAKQLGIDDPDTYFTEDYSSIKTFNNIIDNNDENKYDTLCYQSKISDNVSYPHCVLEHGVGYVRKQGNPDTCVTVECPPDFTFDASKNACKKKSKDAMILKKEKCLERWYDWFTIQNYHLGNKYQKIGDKCYSPCDKGFVPSYTKDPIDNSGGGILDKKDAEPSYCMNKYNYFDGKYEETPNYCPISVIKNIGSTKRDLIEEYENMIEKIESSNEKDNLYKEMNNVIEGIVKNKENIITQDTKMPTGEYLNACNTLNTEERLADAYMKCKRIYDNEDELISQFIQEGDTEKEAKVRILALKRACNGLFCNPNNNVSDLISGKEWPKGSCKGNNTNDCKNIISGEPICFNNIKHEDIEKEAERIRAEKNKKYPEINSKAGFKNLNKTVKSLVSIVFTIIIFGALFISYKFIISPYIVKPAIELILYIWRFIYLYVIQNIRYFFTANKVLPSEYDLSISAKTARREVSKLKKNIKKYDKLLIKLGKKLELLNK